MKLQLFPCLFLALVIGASSIGVAAVHASDSSLADSSLAERIQAFERARTAGDMARVVPLARSLVQANYDAAPISPLDLRAFKADLADALAAAGRRAEAVALVEDLIAQDERSLRTAEDAEASDIMLASADRLDQLATIHVMACPDERPLPPSHPPQDDDDCRPRLALRALDRARGLQETVFGSDNPQVRFVLLRIVALQRRHGLPVDQALEQRIEQLESELGRELNRYRQLGGTRSPGQEDKFETVRVFYGTNREWTAHNNPEKAYGGRQREGSVLTYGSVVVTVPKDRKTGSIQRAGWWDLRGARDGVHFVLKRIEKDGSASAFLNRVNRSIDFADDKSVFVFVHGHRNDFAEAARRTAQLAIDLDIRHGGLFFAWPSSSSLLAYQTSQTNIAPSVASLKTFLMEVLQGAQADRIHLIAHSMGNRLLMRALQGLVADGVIGDEAPFDHIFWAAPDIDAETFMTALPRVSRTARGMTLYGSRRDVALNVSSWLAGDFQRAGQVPPLPGVASQVTAIDTSDVSRDGGHFDFAGGAINDLRAVIWLSLPPEARCPLASKPLDGSVVYWEAAHERENCSDMAFRRAVSALRLYKRDEVVARVEAFIATLKGLEPKDPRIPNWEDALMIIRSVLSVDSVGR